MTNTPKTMTEIRDAEAEKKKIEIEKTLGQGLADICDLVFKAGFDCRDKLDNEALKVAVEALEFYGNKNNWSRGDDSFDVCLSDAPGYPYGYGGHKAREALTKIRELRGNE